MGLFSKESSKIKKEIQKLEEQKSNCLEIKRRLNATLALYTSVQDYLAKSNDYFINGGYTDDNGVTSIDKGRILELKRKIDDLKSSINNFVEKLEVLINEKKRRINSLNRSYNAALENEKTK